jgi:uncharacterized membrane protein HdeD (DUF308 family)
MRARARDDRRETMADGGSSVSESPDVAKALARSWEVGLFVGVVTLGLGIAVALKPSTSLNVIAVFLGILMLVSGIFHLIRALDGSEGHRAWTLVVGLLFVVIGVVMIRHLHLTLSLIALLIGIVWIIQGLVGVIGGFSDTNLPARGWAIFFGFVSLVAGIVVVAWPVNSLTVLAVLLGIWFIILGILQIIGAFYLRHVLTKSS